MKMTKAHTVLGLTAALACFVTSSARGEVPRGVVPAPITSVQTPQVAVIQTCLTAAPAASLTMADLTKGDGNTSVQFPNLQFDGFLMTPAYAPSKSKFYGTPACPNQEIMDFVVNHNTKAAAPLKIRIGPGSRDGSWVESDGSFSYSALDHECANVAGDKSACEKDVCSRTVFWQTTAWKMHGTTSFKKTSQTLVVYAPGPISCIRDATPGHGWVSTGEYHPSQAQSDADGYLHAPTAAGQEDTYRVTAGAALLTCPTVSDNPACSGVMAFTSPTAVPNPIVKQLPVRVIITAK